MEGTAIPETAADILVEALQEWGIVHRRDRSQSGVPDPFSRGTVGGEKPSTVVSSPDIQTPISRQISIGIKREMRAGLAVSADFVNGRGYHLFSGPDINQPDAATGLRPNADFLRIIQYVAPRDFRLSHRVGVAQAAAVRHAEGDQASTSNDPALVGAGLSRPAIAVARRRQPSRCALSKTLVGRNFSCGGTLVVTLAMPRASAGAAAGKSRSNEQRFRWARRLAGDSTVRHRGKHRSC